MSKTKGRVTLPSEGNFLEETKEMMERWGADALRDSDGTKLPEEVKALDATIYTTYFVARGHNEFAKEHMEECQQLYLMSLRVTAVGDTVEIPFMEGYFDQQVVQPLPAETEPSPGAALLATEAEHEVTIAVLLKWESDVHELHVAESVLMGIPEGFPYS